MRIMLHHHQQQRRRASASASASASAAESDGNKNNPIVDPELLSLLACPLTKQPLTEEAVGSEDDASENNNVTGFLLSRAAGARFPVGRGGVPRLRPLQDGEIVGGGAVQEEEDGDAGEAAGGRRRRD